MTTKASVYPSRHRTWQLTNTQEKINAMFDDHQRARFWRLVEQRGEDECWPWKGQRSKIGYGQHSVKSLNQRAHRIAYMLSKGPIPGDLHVLHKCDNRACCNPKHLEAGTIQQNNAHRDVQLKCTKGEKHHTAKLKDEQVLEIYRSKERRSVLARRFGVYSTTIWKIQEGITWKHLTTRRPHG